MRWSSGDSVAYCAHWPSISDQPYFRERVRAPSKVAALPVHLLRGRKCEMIDPAGRLHNPVSQAGMVSVGSRNKAPQSQSFAAELSDKLAVPVTSAARTTDLPANLPAGQRIVNWRDSGATSTPASQPSGLSGLVITYPGTTSGKAGSAGSPATTGTETASDATMSFDQSYWADQPVAVQQLQNIQDPAQRTQVATQLAQDGYTIDVPIMAWGWDPQLTYPASASRRVHLGSFGRATTCRSCAGTYLRWDIL